MWERLRASRLPQGGSLRSSRRLRKGLTRQTGKLFGITQERLAPHELRAYVTRAAKDEAEIDSMGTRGRYVGRAAEAVAIGGLPRLDDMANARVKGAGKDKGKRKTKGGRSGDVQLGAVAAGAAQGP